MSYARFSLAPLMLLALSSQATEAGSFVGVSAFTSLSGNAEAEFQNLDTTISEDLDVGGIRFSVGHRWNTNNRFIFSYESLSFDLNQSKETEDASGIRFDWEFVYGDQQVQPYWGIGFGLYNLQDPVILTGTNLEGDDMSGISFQMGVGVKLNVSDTVEVDLSLQRQAIGWQEIELSYWGGTEKIQMSYVHNSLNAGAAFKF